jgi:hypothetical protein
MGYLMGLPEAAEANLLKAMGDVSPLDPPPAASPARTFATAASVQQGLSAAHWTWEPWIPSDRIVGVAAAEGVGKTRYLLDLCRRVWLGLPWPDGQAMTLCNQTPSVWLCADAHHDEIGETLTGLGVPLDSVVFPAPVDDPYVNTYLDSQETLDWIEGAIVDYRPWCVVIDSLTYATTLDLCEQRSIARLKAPLVRLAQTCRVNVLLSLHVSRDGQALGRRVKGITRTLMHLECPDPGKSERLRLWVEKSYAKKPPALGVTMTGSGNDYDSDPPGRSDQSKGGRPPAEREKAKRFIPEALTRENDQIGNDLCAEWTKRLKCTDDTFWRAVRDMEGAGQIVSDGGKGTGKQMVLHLRVANAA